MNVLFVLYGDFSSNSAIPLALHARQLARRGHHCAVAMPSPADAPGDAPLRSVSFEAALADPAALFPDGKPADILHAWTPREGVRRFVTRYLEKRPTPWIIYLEDNEEWIAHAALALVGFHDATLLQHTEEVISAWTPDGMPHLFRYESLVGLADAAVVIQDKLRAGVPPWVPCTTVMPGVDLESFSPRAADPASRSRYGVREGEHVIVYPGGLNDFTRPGLETLCRAVGLLNQRGVRCRLLRTGPAALDFLDKLPPEAAAAVSDLGVLPRAEMPALLATADILVQPGKPDAFEDLRLPGKLPEFFASGRPVVLPDTNIANLLQDGVDAVFHQGGSAEEIADKCAALLADPERARRIGAAGRRFAETHFDPKAQAARLEGVYASVIATFDPKLSAATWSVADEPVASRLARRLRLLAAAGSPSAAMLETHARCIERYAARTRGLETGMTVRDREMEQLKAQVQELDAHVVAMGEEIDEIHALLRRTIDELTLLGMQRDARITALESSLSWRITRPLRSGLAFAHRMAALIRS